MAIYFIVIVLLIGLVGFGLLTLWGRKAGIPETDRNRIQEMWSVVETMMADDHESAWAKAVMEADKILDYTMKLRRASGNNLGDRLKNSRHMFTNVQPVWEAHKLRNQLAHEVNMKLSRGEAERAVRLFKDGLRQLGGL